MSLIGSSRGYKLKPATLDSVSLTSLTALSGRGLAQSLVVTLPSSLIDTLNTKPITLLPAIPGISYLINLYTVELICPANFVAFPTASTLQIFYGSSSGTTASQTILNTLITSGSANANQFAIG